MCKGMVELVGEGSGGYALCHIPVAPAYDPAPHDVQKEAPADINSSRIRPNEATHAV